MRRKDYESDSRTDARVVRHGPRAILRGYLDKRFASYERSYQSEGVLSNKGSLVRFLPGVTEFLDDILPLDITHACLEKFFDKWAVQESPEYALELGITIEAVLCASTMPKIE